jgi:hypothetical protein
MHQKLYSEVRALSAPVPADAKQRDLFTVVAIAWAVGLLVLVLVMRAF